MYLLVKKDEAGQKGWSKRIRVKFANKPTFLTEMANLYRDSISLILSEFEQCKWKSCDISDAVRLLLMGVLVLMLWFLRGLF